MPTMREVIAEARCAIRSISGFAGRHAPGGCRGRGPWARSDRSSRGTRSSLVSTRHQRRRGPAREALHLGRRAHRAEVAKLELDKSTETGTDADDGVDASGFGHPFGVIPAPESHRVEGEPADRHLAAEMVGIGSDLPDVVHAYVTNEEIRPWISGTARLERRQLERELARQDVRRDLRVDADRWHRSLAAKPLAHDRVQPQGEIRNAIDGDRKARRHGVPAVLDQEVVAL